MTGDESRSQFAPLTMSASTHPAAPFEARVAAAAAAGYRGIGLRPSDRCRAHEAGLTDADMRAVLADAGVEVVELEVLMRWGCDGEVGVRARAHEDRLLALADAVGGHHLVVTGDLDLPRDEVLTRFAALCGRAADRGLRVALEFLPWTEVPNAAAAWALVEEAGHPAGGVLVDVWHHHRGAADDAQLRSIPSDRVVAVQLDDADERVVGTLLEDTLARRRLPGHGDLDLVGFLRLLADVGVRAPLCVEVINDELARLPVGEVARRTAAATRAVLAAAGLAAP